MELLPTDEMLYSTKDRFFIVSLPRTGTKSLCKMFLLLGYNIQHCPSIRLSAYLSTSDVDCFADTPIYRPSLIQKLAQEPSNKFIYIDRDFNDWRASFENVKLDLAYIDYLSRDVNTLKPISKLDRESLIEIFGVETYNPQMVKDAFFKHQRDIFNVIPKEQLLIYRFHEGWEPLCNFLGKEVPQCEIPHLNKNALFDKIE